MTRPRDYAYEALAETTNTDPSTGRGELNRALKDIREQSGIEDSYLLSNEIHERAKMYRQLMPDAMLTPTALSKHWKRVHEEAERKPRTTNAHADPTECPTCDGDRFVIVNLRKAGEKGVTGANFEEWAACPSCSPDLNTSFYRFDGTKVRALDPAKVREMMGQ